MLTSFADVHRVLAAYMPPAGSLHKAYTLSRMRKLMRALGDPQDSLRVIHVAGTSGKTSTCYYLAGLLKAAGQKTGLTVSPHISEVNERLQTDLQPLPEAAFCRQLDAFIQLVKTTGVKPTYFELLIAFAYWTFARAKVDYAIMEVGLGGLLDGTNVVHEPGKICVITDIGYDHMHILGNTLHEIALQKAGIIQPGNHVFVYRQTPEVHEVLQQAITDRRAVMHLVVQGPSRELPEDMALFQTRNWFLAEGVYRYLAERDGLPKLSRKSLLTSARTPIPARMEVFSVGGKTIVLDGAHNAQKMKALTISLKNLFPTESIACLFAFVKNRQDRLKGIVEQLTWAADHLIATSFTSQQDLLKTSLNPSAAVRVCNELGYDDIEVIANPKEALQQLLNRPEPVLLVTGSFYLISQLRPWVIREAEK